MAITSIEPIFIVEMINVKTEVVTTLPSAYESIDVAYEFVDMCKRMDERNNISECFTYRVRQFHLFR